MAVPTQACHPMQAAETFILRVKPPREPVTVKLSSLLIFKYWNWKAALEKEARSYTGNCLPLMVTSSSACQFWPTALLTSTILAQACVNQLHFCVTEGGICPSGITTKWDRRKGAEIKACIVPWLLWVVVLSKATQRHEEKYSVWEIPCRIRIRKNSLIKTEQKTVKYKDYIVCRIIIDHTTAAVVGMENIWFNR